ncbi:TetR/AcrR family transcriptional regulator [Rhodococcoides yunnanense]|uniref:TetR/AcrR family transcriptional regulator n=1 Tax=Rhodococcoides yunnanense TaxID=278209 RepID=UPI000A9E7944
MSAEGQAKWSGTQEPASRPGRENVRERLLDAAADEFTERGFAAAKLQDIARRAGFTKGAVYSNFESKQALFAELLSKRSMELAARVIDDVSGLTPGDAAGRGGHAIASWIVAEPRWPLLVTEFGIQAGRDESIAAGYRRERRNLRAELEALIAERATAWGVADTFDARRVATSLLALISGLAVEHSVDPEVIDETVIGDAVTELFAGALSRARIDTSAAHD